MPPPPYMHPQFQQQQHQQMMGMQHAATHPDYNDDMNVNDDAYDIDEAELLNDVSDQYDLRLDGTNDVVKTSSGSSLSKKQRRHRHHHSREDSDAEGRKRSSDKKVGSRSKKKQAKHRAAKSRRRHSTDSNFSDDDESMSDDMTAFVYGVFCAVLGFGPFLSTIIVICR